MTKLSTYIPIEFIKKSEKLQINGKGFYPGFGVQKLEDVTIADIIDNAEELFGDGKGLMLELDSEHCSTRILIMCQQNKSIEEISTYIIKNLKQQ